jgi:hypothetical protein
MKYLDIRSWAREIPIRCDTPISNEVDASRHSKRIRPGTPWQQSIQLSRPVMPNSRVRIPGPRSRRDATPGEGGFVEPARI